MVTDVRPDRTLDCRNQFCPTPVLRARAEMEMLEPGQVLEILATDRAAQSDIPSWAKWAGHELLLAEQRDGELRFLLRKGA